MSRVELNRALARATGEYITTLERLGFHLVGESPTEDGPLVIDWDDEEPAYLREILSDDDWPGRVGPLPSYDEEFEDVFGEEFAHAAA